MKKLTMNNRGVFYTLITLLLLIPVVLLITFYVQESRTQTSDLVGRLRCDELHYFVEDVKEDLRRVAETSSRRAAVYAVSDVVTRGIPLENYTFHNCTGYFYNETGSEAAIAELMLCGTLYGNKSEYMYNHTMEKWLDKRELIGSDRNFNVTLEVLNITVVPKDAWNFAVFSGVTLNVSDSSGMCYYVGTNITLTSTTSIIGLEDPLYPLHTNDRFSKYIINCNGTILPTEVIGNGTKGGNGEGWGTTVLVGDVRDVYGTACKKAIEDFCADGGWNDSGTWLPLDQIVLTYNDQCWGSIQSTDQVCLDSFAAILGCGPGSSQDISADVTIPWVSSPSTDNCPFGLSTGDCVGVRADAAEGLYQVLSSFSSKDVDTSCYYVSDVTRYGSMCLENYSNGASFFDRLDGRLNVSEKYVNQSLAYFNNRYIGLESLADIYDFHDLGLWINENATWIDYLYWQNISACKVTQVCPGNDIFLYMMDCPHADKYGINLTCGAGVCGDGVCTENETCYADASNCTHMDGLCQRPVCYHGCDWVWVVNATDPGDCDATTTDGACASAPCYCDESSVCIDGAPTPCGDGVCSAGEICPADNNACPAEDTQCYEPVCSNGCDKIPVGLGQEDEACNGTMHCDGNGTCIPDVCGNSLCEPGENCSADSVSCTDTMCYEPTCLSGCGEVFVADGDEDEACSGAMHCDGAGGCVADCLPKATPCTVDAECCSGNCLPAGKCQ